jgi:NAD(P)-dependent dehydrogenase (short-subunit alcohol dehydrogenase family)
MTQTLRVALITGASRGLGAVIARVLAERGHALVLGARSEPELHAAAMALQGSGRSIVTVAGDVADPQVRERLVAAADRIRRLDVVINNASELGGIAPLSAFDLGRLERVLNVNLVAPVGLVQRARPLLAAAQGLVVNISSDAALGGYPGWGAYGASKAALDLASRTMAAELRDQGISVVSVDPGDLRTRMHQEAFPGEDISDRPLPEVTRAFWEWLFDQPASSVTGERFRAQAEEARWTVSA